MLIVAAASAGSALVVTAPLADPDLIVSLASKEWERLPTAAELAVEHPRAVVLLTLPQPPSLVNCHDCANRTDRLRHMGVDPARVQVVPLTAEGTYGEALAARTIATEQRARRLVVVTSPYHTRRSLATFEKVFAGTGVRIGVVPASRTSPARPTRWWTAPYDRWYVAYEWAALVYYGVRYAVWPVV